MRFALVLACSIAGCALDRSPIDPGSRDAAVPTVDGSRDGGLVEPDARVPDGGGPLDAGSPDGGGVVGIVAIAAGRAFTCALRSNGRVSCWGDNADNQLGDVGAASSEAAITIALPGRATAIAAGDAHACAILSDARLFCWGNNDNGQVDGTMADPVSVPILVHTDVDAVALGGKHSCLLDSAGTARSCARALRR